MVAGRWGTTFCLQRRESQELELDLHHYEVPPPVFSADREGGVQYVANAAEDPRSVLQRSVTVPVPDGQLSGLRLGKVDITESRDRCVSIKV